MGIFYYILGVIGSVATIIIAADLEVHTRYIAGIMSKLGTVTLGILVMHGPLSARSNAIKPVVRSFVR